MPILHPGRLTRSITFALLLVSAVAAAAGEFDDLVGSDSSPNFTPAERALFLDASNRFKKFEIPKGIIASGLYWLDNDHLAFSSRSHAGWKARPDEPSRIVSYNFRTGEIIDSGYRGILRCLNHLGDILIHQADKEGGTYSKPEAYRWLAGKWGKPLETIEYVPKTFIAQHLCRFVPFGPPIFNYPPEKLPPDAAMLTPLLLGDGTLKETVARENGALVDQLHLVKSTGQVSFLGDRRLNKFRLIYLPWREAYFESATSRTGPRTILTTGESVVHQAPRLIRFWTRQGFPSSAGYAFRDGILWTVHQSWGDWRKQGVYRATNENLVRIDDGDPRGAIEVSPNGCWAAINSHEGDRYSLRKTNYVFVIDVCIERIK